MMNEQIIMMLRRLCECNSAVYIKSETKVCVDAESIAL
jgi:hypothetical protein